MVRKVLAGLLFCALLQAPAAEASISLSAYELNEGTMRIGTVRVRLFALSVAAQQPLTVSALSDDFEPLIYLVSPDKRVWFGDEPAEGRSSVSIDAAAPGTWYVAVRSLGSLAGDAFALGVDIGDPVPVGPALPPDAEVAVAALRLWSGIGDPTGRYSGRTRSLQIPDGDALPETADPMPPPPTHSKPKPLEPLLPWPPPEPSARMVLPRRLLADRATLGEVDDRLRNVLSGAGYDDLGYFAVPNGYAAVTRLERTDEVGKSIVGASRWELAVPAAQSFDLFDYLKALLTAQTGHFRVIAFVVTPAPFTASAAEVDALSAQRWAQSGHNALTPALRSQPFTAEFSVTALVYEFSKSRGERTVHFDLPGDLTATTHLQEAGILAALQN